MRAAAKRDAMFIAGVAAGVVVIAAGVVRDEISLIMTGAGLITGSSATALPPKKEEEEET